MNALIWPFLDRLGFAVIRTLLAVLWQSSLLFAAVAGLAWVLRGRRASVRHVLWAAALLLAPLLPALAAVASRAGAPQAAVRALPVYVEPVNELPSLPPAPARAPAAGRVSAPSPRADLPRAEPAPVSALAFPWAFLLIVYAAGLGAFLAWMAAGWTRIRRWIASAAPATDPRTLDAFRAAADSLRLRRSFLVLESPRVPAPASVGLLRGLVLLPRALGVGLADADLRDVALHEVAHVKRRDALWLCLASLVRAALFFHPLVWLAARQVAALGEHAADDAVLDTAGEPLPYARMLTRFAEGLPRRSPTAEVAVGISFSRTAFLRRVEAILSHRRHQVRRLTRRAFAGTVLAAVASVALAAVLPLADKPQPAPAKAEAVPGPSAAPGPSAVPGPLSAPGVAARPSEPWRAKLEEALSKRVEFSFNDTPLKDVVDFLRQMTRQNFVLDPAAVAQDEHLVTLTVQPIKLASALNLICGDQLGWALADEVILIGPRDKATSIGRLKLFFPATAGPERRPEPWEADFRKVLQNRVEFSFNDTPLKDVVDFLRELSKRNFVLDPAAVAQDQRLVTLTLKDIKLESALNLICLIGPGDLEWKLRDEALFISARRWGPPMEDMERFGPPTTGIGMAAVPSGGRPPPGMPGGSTGTGGTIPGSGSAALAPPAYAAEGAPAPKPTEPWEEKIRAALQKPVDLSFEGTPLKDVLDFLRTLTKENIVLDPAVIAEDPRLITLTAKNVKLESALNLICAIGGDLEWRLRDEVLYISRRRPHMTASIGIGVEPLPFGPGLVPRVSASVTPTHEEQITPPLAAPAPLPGSGRLMGGPGLPPAAASPGAPSPKSSAEATPWGPALAGARCRLRADKASWPQGETPALKLDVRNEGVTDCLASHGPAGWEIEVDGTAYRWSGKNGAPASILPPGRERTDMPVTLDARWHDKENNRPLKLSPGKHTVRLLFSLLPGLAVLVQPPGTWAPIVLQSNAVAITVTETKTGADTGTRP